MAGMIKKASQRAPRYISFCLILVITCMVFGCNSKMSAGSRPSYSTVSSQADLPDSASIGEEIDEALTDTKLLHAELEKRLGTTELQLNERYCFYFNGSYVIAGGSGTPVSDLNALKQYYPDWEIPAQIEGYHFQQASILADDSLTFATRKALPQGAKKDVLETIALSPQFIRSFRLNYTADTQSLWVNAYSMDYSFLQTPSTQEIEKMDNGYTLLKNSETGVPFLQWEDGAFVFELGSTDSRLDLEALTNSNLKEMLQLPSTQ